MSRLQPTPPGAEDMPFVRLHVKAQSSKAVSGAADPVSDYVPLDFTGWSPAACGPVTSVTWIPLSPELMPDGRLLTTNPADTNFKYQTHFVTGSTVTFEQVRTLPGPAPRGAGWSGLGFTPVQMVPILGGGFVAAQMWRSEYNTSSGYTQYEVYLATYTYAGGDFSNLAITATPYSWNNNGGADASSLVVSWQPYHKMAAVNGDAISVPLGWNPGGGNPASGGRSYYRVAANGLTPTLTGITGWGTTSAEGSGYITLTGQMKGPVKGRILDWRRDIVSNSGYRQEFWLIDAASISILGKYNVNIGSITVTDGSGHFWFPINGDRLGYYSTVGYNQILVYDAAGFAQPSSVATVTLGDGAHGRPFSVTRIADNKVFVLFAASGAAGAVSGAVFDYNPTTYAFTLNGSYQTLGTLHAAETGAVDPTTVVFTPLSGNRAFVWWMTTGGRYYHTILKGAN